MIWFLLSFLNDFKLFRGLSVNTVKVASIAIACQAFLKFFLLLTTLDTTMHGHAFCTPAAIEAEKSILF